MKHWTFDAARFAAERSRVGMTLDEFATLLNLPGGRQRVWSYESGSRQPSYRTAAAIAKSLGVPLTDILLPADTAAARMELLTRWRNGEFGPEPFHVTFDLAVMG